MPTYDYRCGMCDAVFEVRRPMARSSEAATCPNGHEGARRLLSVFAAVGGTEAARPKTPVTTGGCGAACACHPG
ncbi:MAG: zinc ribbon domain-containing protein [Actinomycetota bacterium]|nr:zinc ribbon domain-containing protein [Acidimicrobiales bacterium]MEC8970859.1 zinc ribbon domain-containing protein [Actinomycetota bacterium]MEC8982798.1 zinc ribbon domain-containing protein [Actinomycetota bacterium]MEC9426415.1 zinc ribbon domain-containing protein [Actinomycetota bacterium]MEC9449486.1 zinc ribbon domain-containing protein [Actinomycetota bacterium]